MTVHQTTISILFLLTQVNTIWPPPYKVNLHHEEVFEIGEYIENKDNNDYNIEDEMINNPNEKIETNKPQLAQLHKLVKRYNDEATKNDYLLNATRIFAEENELYSELMESEPWQTGFVGKKNEFIKNQENMNVYYWNTMSKRIVDQKIEEKRNEPTENDYNYNDLNQEYENEVLKLKKAKNTYNASNIKEEESVKEALHEMVDFKTKPKNCTAEELNGIGFGAIQCIWLEVRNKKSKTSMSELFSKIKRILLIWFSIYLVIAVPCWCQRGWCCCCFQCKFCKPRKRLDEAKKYLMDNPPGTFVGKDNQVIKYEPTVYETRAYNKLQRALLNI